MSRNGACSLFAGFHNRFGHSEPLNSFPSFLLIFTAWLWWGVRITGRSHPAAWLVPNTWLLFPPLSFSLSSSLPVSSNQESLLLSPPGKSCLPPSFLVSCFLLYAVLLKNSFSLNKFRKIAPSHYRWAGHPPHYSHPHLGLSTRPPKREELFWAKERGSKT